MRGRFFEEKRKTRIMYRTPSRFVRGTCIALLLGLAPIYSAAAFETSNIEAKLASLDAGEFVWQPQAAREGEVRIVVSLPLQMAYVFRGQDLIGASTVSTGKPGNDTPTGSFTILQKRKDHKSNLYDDAPMPYMQRLTWDGIALHAGAIPGVPASHGCVRLPMKFAQKLFAITELGAQVHIVDVAPRSTKAALALIEGGAATELAAAP